jgi:hypothetical protein
MRMRSLADEPAPPPGGWPPRDPGAVGAGFRLVPPEPRVLGLLVAPVVRRVFPGFFGGARFVRFGREGLAFVFLATPAMIKSPREAG